VIQVYCSNCRRPIAVADKDYSVVLFCDERCAEQAPVSDNEPRDDLIGLVARKGEVTKAEIARTFGLTRQRVSQISSERP
jgi:hypothetical protein